MAPVLLRTRDQLWLQGGTRGSCSSSWDGHRFTASSFFCDISLLLKLENSAFWSGRRARLVKYKVVVSVTLLFTMIIFSSSLVLVEIWSQEFFEFPFPFLQIPKHTPSHTGSWQGGFLWCEWGTRGGQQILSPCSPFPNPALQNKTELHSLFAPLSHHRFHLCLAKCSQILQSWRCYLNGNYYLQYLMLDISFGEVSSLHLFAAAYPFTAIIYMQRFSLSYHTFSNMFWWSLNSSNWAPALCILFISYLVCIKFCHRLGLAFILQ